MAPRLTGVSRLLRVVLMALLTVLLVTPGGAAWAHDELIGSDPEDGATLDGAPGAITLTFSGPISDLGVQVVLQDSSGGALTEGGPRVEGTEVEQDLADLGPGSYTVLWRVTSSDGHPISGDLTFTVAGAGDEPAEETTAGTIAAAEESSAPATEDGATADTITEDSTSDAVREGGGGLPVWVWVVLGAVVLGLVALLARTWARGRA
jgi:hypothetical protein